MSWKAKDLREITDYSLLISVMREGLLVYYIIRGASGSPSEDLATREQMTPTRWIYSAKDAEATTSTTFANYHWYCPPIDDFYSLPIQDEV